MPQGFKIASAWVEIKADTTGLRRDVEGGVRRALAGVDAKIKLAADATGLRAQVRAAAKKAGAGETATIKIKTDFNVAEARAKMMAGIKGLNLHTDVKINPDINGALLAAKIKAEVNALKGRFTVPVTPDINTTQFAAKIRAAARTVAGSDADIPIDLNPRINQLRLRAEAARVAGLVNQAITFNADLDEGMLQARVAAAVARLNAMPHDLTFRARVDVDRNRVANALGEISRAFDKSSGHIGRWTKIVLAIGTLGPPAIAALLPAINTLGTASLALIPTLSALALTIGTIAVGGNGVVNAITASAKSAKQFDEAMEHLTPTAQDFVHAVVGSKGAFRDLQDSVQNVLFDDLDDSFRSMARTTIPDLRIGLGGTAIQLNEMAKSGMNTLETLSRMGLLKTMFGGLQLAMDPLVPMPGQFLNMLTKLTIAGTPLFLRMTTAFGNGVEGLNDKINRLFESGLLQAKISKAGDDIVNFFRRIGNNPEWQQFVNRMQQTGPDMARVLGDISEAVLKLMNDAGPLAGVVLQVAAAFARFVTSLPDGLVTTLMSVYLAMKLIGLAGAVLGRVAGFVLKLGTAIRILVSQQAAIAAIAPALTRIGMTAGGISKAAVALRLMGAAAVGLGILVVAKQIIDHFADSASGAAPDVDKLQVSLNRLVKTGNVGGELKKTFGDIEGLSEGFKILDRGIEKNIGNWEKLMGDTAVSDWTREVIDNFKNGDKSIEGTTKKIDGLDKALAEMVNSGHGDIAAAAVRKLGVGTKDSKKYLDEYNKALQSQKLAEDLAATSMGQFGDRAVETSRKLDQLKKDTDGLRESLFALNNVNRDSVSALSDYEAAADAATAQAKKHVGALTYTNGVISQNTQDQRDNVQVLTDLASKTEAAGMATYQANGNWQQASQIWRDGHSQLVSLGQQMGLSQTEAIAFADSILKIPTEKQIRLEMVGQAQEQLDGVVSAFKAAPDKKTITVDALSETAIQVLGDLGYKVKQLPNGKFSVTADDKDAKGKLDKLSKYKVSDKDVKVSADVADAKAKLADVTKKLKDPNLTKERRAKLTADKKDLEAKIAAATKAKVPDKTSKLKADKSDFDSKKRSADSAVLKTHTSSIRGNKGPFDSTVSAVRNTSIASKTVNIVANVVGAAKKFLGFARGGLVPMYADGGSVAGGVLQGPGTKTSDSLVARLSKGEFVMQAKAVDHYGPRFMEAVNMGLLPRIPTFAVGGYTKKRTVGKGSSKRTQYYYQGQWMEKDAYDKAYGAAKQIDSLTSFSHFGKMAKAQGSFKHNEMENELGQPGSINDLVNNLNKYRGLIQTSTSGKKESGLLKKLDSSGKALLAQQKKYEAVNKSLDAAKDKLDGLKQSFNQLKDSVASSIVSFGNITKSGKYGTSVNTLISQLQSDTTKATTFADMLEQLKAKGLNSQALSDIAAAGISGGGMATAQTLLGASAEDIKKINQLQSQLTSAANAAGTTVAESMYGAGIKAAEGLVAGLTSQQKAIEASMMAIAKSMEAAIKKALGIKSPSRVMMGLGSYVAEGFALGIEQSDRPMGASLSMAQQTPAAVSNTPTGTAGGIVINGGLTVCVEGTFDLTNAQQRKNIANSLADEIVKATRRHDRARS